MIIILVHRRTRKCRLDYERTAEIEPNENDECAVSSSHNCFHNNLIMKHAAKLSFE